ncbi:MAG TPA: hypothetical protein VHA52_01675 [Candidatus Babeliaceae bacterium]|nr:hypothetical protein [Candidatus Babeliaceae bacterium]
MTLTRKTIVGLLATVMGISAVLNIGLNAQTSALSGSQFKAGYIISDELFYKSNAMTSTQIQNFLNSKVPTCDTNGTTQKSYYYNSSTGRVNNSADKWVTTSRATYGQRYDHYYGTTIAAAPYTCLKNYTQNTPSEAAESGICGNIPAHTGRSAALMIADVSSACGVSPKVLIVLLQKEQGLVTDDWPWDNEYQAATGYGCPDTSGCDSAYYGFFNQIYHAAKQYRIYRANPDYFNFIAGQNNQIPYNPNSSCGTGKVYIQNQATAGLYDYTPYQPNKAALNNLTGIGDSCSAYGNRNFWVYYNQWFGSTTISFNFVSLDRPRWMKLASTVYKKDLATGANIDSALPAGMEIYFDTKVEVNGRWYLRTKNDTGLSLEKGILLTDTQDISATYTSVTQPRWMKTKTTIYKKDPITDKNTGAAIPAGTTIFFPTKFEVGGQTFARTQHDTNTNTSAGILLTSLEDTTLTYTSMLQPRWMQAHIHTNVLDLKSYAPTGSAINNGGQRYFDTKVILNGATYLSNGTPPSGNYTGVPISDMQEIPFTTLLTPRYMVARVDTHKKNPATGEQVGDTIPAGTKIYFPTKMIVNNSMFLRTQYGTGNNLAEGIPISDLEEDYISLEHPRYMTTKISLKEVNPATGSLVGGTIPAGTKLYFPTKVEIGNKAFLRTQQDTTGNLDQGILLSDLAEVSL